MSSGCVLLWRFNWRKTASKHLPAIVEIHFPWACLTEVSVLAISQNYSQLLEATWHAPHHWPLQSQSPCPWKAQYLTRAHLIRSVLSRITSFLITQHQFIWGLNKIPLSSPYNHNLITGVTPTIIHKPAPTQGEEITQDANTRGYKFFQTILEFCLPKMSKQSIHKSLYIYLVYKESTEYSIHISDLSIYRHRLTPRFTSLKMDWGKWYPNAQSSPLLSFLSVDTPQRALRTSIYLPSPRSQHPHSESWARFLRSSR